MQWLTYFLGVKTPEDTHLHAAELGFRGMFAWWLVVPAVVLTAALVFLLYFRERGKLGPARRSILAVLRVAVLVFLILLMLRPVLLAEFKGQRPRSIVLLIDNTQSMKQTDRRMSFKDQGRVAIAQALVEPNISLDKFSSVSDIPGNTLKDPARMELVKAVLKNDKLKLIAALKKHGPVRPYLFGDKMYSVVEETDDKQQKPADISEADFKANILSVQLVKMLDAGQEKTAIANHIMEILHKKEGDLPAAIVLMTDGLANADHGSLIEAAKECAALKVPLYIYGVGSTEGGILQITDVKVPPTILYEDKVSIPIHWRASGFKKEGVVQITMTLDGKEVGKKEIRVKNGEDLREEMMLIPKKFLPEKKKDDKLDVTNKLVVTIEMKDNPLFKDKVEQQVFISDKKIKVLYIENAPRWEYKFLQPLLVREQQAGRMEAHFILVQAAAEVSKKAPFLSAFPPREEFFKTDYDLIILGDVPQAFLGKKNLEFIKEFVEKSRGGLIVIAGDQNMPSGYDNTALADILPVDFLPKKNQPDPNAHQEPYTPMLTKAGETSGMLDLTGAEDEGKDPADKDKGGKKNNLDIWKNLPGFYWNYDMLTKLKPGASALLVHSRKKMGKEPMPVLATHYYGKGQVLFMATDETWRWRKNEENKYFAAFWGQIIYQLALPHHLGGASKKVKMMLEQSEAILNRKGYIYASLKDDKFMPLVIGPPLVDGKLVAKLTHLNPKTGAPKTEDVVFKAVDEKNQPGEYKMLMPHDQEGRYEIKIPGMDYTFNYQVKVPPRHELEEAPLAEDSLSQAAKVSGGAYYREEDLHHLGSDVQEQKTPFALHQEILLWNPLAFWIFILLITAEWVLRKFSNLT